MSENARSGLAFTGERFIPGEGGARIAYEHLHRYFLARRLAQGKVVLDLGCGEGYGSNLLAEVAAEVTGVELSAEVVEHARRHYPRPNLKFVSADCRKTNLPGRPYDLIVCFEMIEHIAEHDELLAEVRRLLKPDGIFIVSSPDKKSYSDAASFENPFHVKELYACEFQALLEKNFQQSAFFGQKTCVGSVIWRLDHAGSREKRQAELIEVKANREKRYERLEPSEQVARYILGVCSAVPLPAAIDEMAFSAWNDSDERMLQEVEHHNQELQNALGRMESQLKDLSCRVGEREQRMAQQDQMLQENLREMARLCQVSSEKDTTLAALESEIQSKETQIRLLAQENLALHQFEEKVKASRGWRIYRFFGRPIQALLKRF